MPSRHPNVLWAQRKDHVYLTIDLQDVANPDIKLGTDADGHGTVAFRGKGEGADPEAHEYAVDLALYGGIDTAAAKIATTARHIVLALPKKEAGEAADPKGKAKEGGAGKEEGEAYWPRLLAAPGKAPAFVKVDWDKWVDEDEEGAAAGLGGFDFGDFGGGGMMGGGGGGGMDLSSLMAGMGGAGAGGGAQFDMGAFGGEEGGYGDDDEEEEDGEGTDAPAPVDAPAVASTTPAEEVTA